MPSHKIRAWRFCAMLFEQCIFPALKFPNLRHCLCRSGRT
jgi:hypothetical protein